MQCTQFRDLLPDLQLKNVEPVKEAEARSHASACQGCGAVLAAERDLDALIGAASNTLMPPPGSAARVWRAMVGGPAPAARWLATAAAVLLLAGAGTLPFLLGGDASADSLVARAVELYRLEAAATPANCCGTPDPKLVPKDQGALEALLLSRTERHGWRFADAHRNTGAVGGVRLSFRKRDVLLTCLMVPDRGYQLGEATTANGHTYHVYTTPGLTHLIQRLADGRLCILSADLDAKALADLTLSADAGAPTSETTASTPLTWRVGNIHCDRCGAVVKASLEAVDGVVRAAVDAPGAEPDQRTVKLWLAARVRDRAPVLDVARRALADAGFTVADR